MEIILLQKVANLGQIGDRVKVKSGYARNFLVPDGQGDHGDVRQHRQVRGAARRARGQGPRGARGGAGARRSSSRTSSSRSRPRPAPKASCSDRSARRTSPRPRSKAGQPIARSEVRMPTGPIRYDRRAPGPAAPAYRRRCDLDGHNRRRRVAAGTSRGAQIARGHSRRQSVWVRARRPTTDCGCRRIPSRPSNRCSAD